VGGHAEVLLHVLAEETETDENRRSVFAHNDVRLAGHALDIEPVAVSVCPQPSPHKHFRLGCLAAYMRHTAMTLGGCHKIRHKIKTITFSETCLKTCLKISIFLDIVSKVSYKSFCFKYIAPRFSRPLNLYLLSQMLFCSRH